MQLHRLLGDELGAAANLGLGHQGHFDGAVRVALDIERGQLAGGLGFLAAHRHFG
ncbi:hypothetical protein D9M71_718480 [compost metagenome]